MSKAYWMGHIDIHHVEPYSRYLDPATKAVHAYGGRFLVRGGNAETVEGASRARHVLIEFPSLAAARECYHSTEYQAARAMRESHSTGDIVIVEGI